MNPERVVVNDVGPRDGLQNQPKILLPDERLQLVTALAAAGVSAIEIGSFVSPKAVPAMAGTDLLASKLQHQRDEVLYSALIPNLRGYELARAAGLRAVGMVLYASESMAQKNVGRSIAEVEAATREMLALAQQDNIRVLATIAVGFGCPFEGEVKPAAVAAVAKRALDMGVDELIIADTIGAANPRQVQQLMELLVGEHGAGKLGCHFHDTRAMGLANVYAGLQAGIRKFDASIAGLGGCPFAPGASGNVATEDVVMMLHQMGFETGIDLGALLQAAKLAQELTGSAPGGRATIWLRRQYA